MYLNGLLLDIYVPTLSVRDWLRRIFRSEIFCRRLTGNVRLKLKFFENTLMISLSFFSFFPHLPYKGVICSERSVNFAPAMGDL
jgi:hypothetical protein